MLQHSSQPERTFVKLPDILVPTYVQMLKGLASWLSKAEAQRPDGGAEALLSASLAPDMFPLSTQIRFACVQAQEGVFRLQGRPFPATIEILLNEGREAAEHPGTLADAKARIDATIEVVEAAAADMRDVDPTSRVAHALPAGMIFDLDAGQYVRDWALPQFYFHVITAYAILRSEGIDLGKADYVAHMLPFLRPGTMPAA
jgi:hypothetical protein